MAELVVKEGDTLPTLTDTLNTAESLSGGDVTLYVQRTGTDELLVNDTATVNDDTAGAADVEYQFSDTQTANTGTHLAEWVVTYSDGDTETFPKNGYITVTFDDQLNRGGSVTASGASTAGPIDVLEFNEQASAPDAPAADDWGLYVQDDGDVVKIDENGTVTQIGGGGGGSAVEVQEDGASLTTDVTLIDVLGGLTATEPAADEIDLTVDESEVDHDALLNFVANDHIDHSAVSIAAGNALSGGGDITASRTIDVAADGIQTPEIDLAISPTWTGNHRFDDFIDLGAVAAPGSPGAGVLRLWAESEAGHDFLHGINSTGIDRELSRDTVHVVRNETGTAMAAGDVVYVTGANGQYPTVGLARADSTATMPAVGILMEDIPDASNGLLIQYGDLSVDTSAFTDGDEVFVSPTTAGELTATPPSGADIRQRMGVVANGGVANGTVVVETQSEIDPSLIPHDDISGFVADEHVDHSTVSVSAGDALSGGGDITVSRTIDLDIASATDLASPATDDKLVLADTSNADAVRRADLASIVNLADHDQLTNFVANEHVDHSTVSITAGDGLTGGGDITASRTLDTRLDIDDGGADVTGAYGINFGTDLGVTDDGDNTVTVDFTGSGGGDSWSVTSITSADSPYSASDNELVVADASNGAITINAPTPGSDVQFAVKVSDATNNVTVSRSGTENIDGDAADDTLTVEDTSRTYISGGTDWFVRAFDPFQLPAGGKIHSDAVNEAALVDIDNINSGFGFDNADDPGLFRNDSVVFTTAAPVGKLQFTSNACALSRSGSGSGEDLEVLSDGHIQLGTPNIELEATTETNDGMTADPESATEDAFWSVKIGSTQYQIPLYAA